MSLCFQCPWVSVSIPNLSRLDFAHSSGLIISQRLDCPESLVSTTNGWTHNISILSKLIKEHPKIKTGFLLIID